MVRRCQAALLAALCSLATGCSGNALPGVPAQVPQREAALRAPLPERAASPLLYVYDGRIPPGAIDEYPLGGGKYVRSIANANSPQAFAIDAQGTLFVTNARGASYNVTEYARGSTSALRTITRGLGRPWALALDGASNLYALDANGGPLVKYDAGTVTPAFSTRRGICYAGIQPQLAADRFGTVYVQSGCGDLSNLRQVVSEYDGTANVARQISIPNTQLPFGMTVDRNGRLYFQFVDFSPGKNRGRLGIAEYDRGKTTPVRTFDFGPASRNGTGADLPVVDPATGDLYADLGSCWSVNSGPFKCVSSIFVFAANASVPKRVIPAPPNTTIASPAIDPSGNLYTEVYKINSVYNSIRVYPQDGGHWREILSGPHLLLLFAWPGAGVFHNVARASAELGSMQFTTVAGGAR
jgi:hypothetical protein